MLQDIRQTIQGTTAKIVVGLIVISFAFFGIQSILVKGGGNEVAEVNGEEISPQELQQSVDTQRRRLIAMMGENLDPAMLDDDRLKAQALEALINRKLLMQSAAAMSLAISESEIGAVVSGMEQFQVDGAFSPAVYKSLLSSAGYTPSSFKRSLRGDMLLNQLRNGLAGSEFVTPSELEVSARVISEQRDLRYFTIPKEKFVAASPPSDTRIDAYYNEHLDEYQSPESVDIDYIELSPENFKEPVAESAVLEAYELAKQDAQYQTQNRVSHILFQSDGNNDLQQRIAKAQQLLASGMAFADVARQLSEDMGSAAKGGDLGYSSGDAFPEEMEAAIARLEPGVVSDPVKTDAGTHLILVTERIPGKAPSLEQMRAQLEETIAANEARVALVRTVESLKDLSFNAEDLSYPAEELGLEVKQVDAVTRSTNEGLFSNPSVLDAAFSDDVLVQGHNSEVMELAGDRYVVLHVRSHHTPELQPLASVRDAVVAAVTENDARAAVAAAAESALVQLRAGLPVEQYAHDQGYNPQVELGVDRRNNTVPPDVLRRAFALPTPDPDTASTDFIMTSSGDAVVIQLERVISGEYTSLGKNEQQQLQQSLDAEFGSLVNHEFERGLREAADISVL